MFRSKIKSYCKINLFLKVLNKLKNNYHTIVTLVTFSELHDLIFISKIEKSRDVISFTGKYKKGINKKKNTITKLLHILRKNKLMRNVTETVKHLLIINVIFFFATISIGDNVYDWFALHYFENEKFEYWQLLSHMFMHGNINHILL